VIPKVVWTYWEGPKPPYIEYCLDTITSMSGVKVVVLNKDTVDNYVSNGVLHKNYRNVTNLAQKSDAIRLALLWEHGGAWIDADTLIIRDYSHLFEGDCDCSLMRWGHNNSILNGYIFAAKRSKLMEECLLDVNNRLVANKDYYASSSGCAFGEDIINFQSNRLDINVRSISLNTFLPVPFPTYPTAWCDNTCIINAIRPTTVAIGLNNSHMPPGTSRISVDKIMASNNLLGSVFRLSRGYMSYKHLTKEKRPCLTPVRTAEASAKQLSARTTQQRQSTTAKRATSLRT